MNLLPIWAVFHAWSNLKFDRSNSTGHEILCSNWVEIHWDYICMPAWSNWVSFQWIYSHFEQYFMPGQISNLTGRIRPAMKYCSIWVEIHGFTPNLSSISGLVELGIIPMNLLPFWAVFHAQSNFKFDRSNSTGHEILLNLGWNSWIYTQFEQYFRPGQIGYHSNEFTPILSSISCPVKFQIWLVEFNRPWNTAQIGLKFTEIIFVCLPDRIGYHSNEFTPILSSISCPVKFQIRPAMKYCSKWVEIHWDYICMPAWSNWVSFQWIYSHFEQYFMPGRIQPVKFEIRPGMKYWLKWV